AVNGRHKGGRTFCWQQSGRGKSRNHVRRSAPDKQAARRPREAGRPHLTQAATESSMGGDRGGRPRNSEGRPAAVNRIPPHLRSHLHGDGHSDVATRSRGGLERREASLGRPNPAPIIRRDASLRVKSPPHAPLGKLGTNWTFRAKRFVQHNWVSAN